MKVTKLKKVRYKTKIYRPLTMTEVQSINDVVGAMSYICEYLEGKLNDCPNVDEIKAINTLRMVKGTVKNVLKIAATNFDYVCEDCIVKEEAK